MAVASNDYKTIYHRLYETGYHSGGLNHGARMADPIIENYDFESVLDIGCSQGLAVKKFQDAGKRACGIDVSKKAIEMAREMNVEGCVMASATDIPFGDDEFDAVYTTDMLEHLSEDDVPKAAAEICRVAKKYIFANIAFVPEKNKEPLKVLHEKFDDMDEVDCLHLTVKPREWWIEQFENEGASVVEAEGPNGMVILKVD